MSSPVPNSYDEIPYEHGPFSQTYPDRLATIGTLLGLKPPNINRSWVLELGCASGANLIPMALALPDSTFVGVDLSGRQIERGKEIVEKLGLTNIELRHQSITDLSSREGPFDYIICHGVYSWVPPAVQDKILAICSENLSPDGIAYISYNTLPGWRMRGTIRDMMCFHANRFAEPNDRVKQARLLLDFMVKSSADANTPFSNFLKNELDVLQECNDSYLFHEHLEEFNEPLYFHEFIKRAEAKKLRYLAEADLHVMLPGNFPREVESVLDQLSPDIIHLEQFMDFLRNRLFRQTLLCHAHQSPSYGLRPEQLRAFSVGASPQPTTACEDLNSLESLQFRNDKGLTVTVRQPIAKAALLSLSQLWPQAIPFDDLCRMARARLSPSGEVDAQTLAQDQKQLGETLLTCYTSASRGLVELHLNPPSFATAISAKPMVSGLARLQAADGRHIANLRNEVVVVTMLERQLLQMLDGTRDRPTLVERLTELAEAGTLTVTEEEAVIKDITRLREIMVDALDQTLPKFARCALLVS